MEMPLGARLIHIFYVWLAISLSWLFLNIIFDNAIYPLKVLPVVVVAFLWAFVTHLVYKKINQWQLFLVAHPKKIAGFILAFVALLQFYCGYQLAIGTGGDVEAVFRGAINLATYANLANYTEYFQIFPHNLGGALLLSYVFKLGALFGCFDYYIMGVLLNIVCVSIGFFLVFLICNRLQGYRAGFIALWLCMSCLPIYLYIPIFYTDVFSLPFIPLLYYVYLRSQESEGIKKLLAYSLLFGVVCALGCLIKFTAIIMAIAILIDIIFRKKLVRYALPMMLALCSYKATVLVFNAQIYNSVLSEQAVDNIRVPYTHWIMMGLAGNGAYNGGDYQYTYSFSDPEERVQANINVIKERLRAYGFWGYLEFATRKQTLSFGSGLYGAYEILDDNPLRQSYLHNFALETGKYFFVLKNVAQGYHVFLFVLIIASLLYDLYFKSPKISVALIPRLATSGIFLFLLLWEACPRYIINYIPVFVICIGLSYNNIFLLLKSIKITFLDVVHAHHAGLLEKEPVSDMRN